MTQSDLVYEVDKKSYSITQGEVTFPPTTFRDGSGFPSPRSFHTSCIYGRIMYVFGGVGKDKQTIPIYDYFYKLNLDTYEWEKIKLDTIYPGPRDRHCAVVFNNLMYVYGGANLSNVYDDLWAFNFNTESWRKIDVKIKPRARQSATLINYQNKYLFLFGGIDVANIVCSNSFLFNPEDNRWIDLKHCGDDCYRCFPALTNSERFFIFGGGKNALLAGNLSKDLYELVLDINHLELKTLPVLPSKQSNISPLGMIHHSIMELGNNFLLIFGGMIEGKQTGILMNDQLWIYKRQSSVWQAIKIPKLEARAKFSVCKKDNTIIIFGGTKAENETSDDLVIITFPEIKNYVSSTPIPLPPKPEVLINTQKNHKQLDVQKALVSTSFYGTIASMIKHPFSAIAHFVDCATMFNPSYIRITRLRKPDINHSLYLKFSFDGDRSLSYFEFFSALTSGLQRSQNSPNNKEMTTFGNKLKLGGLRLGKTILFVHTSKNIRNVAMISTNSSVVPNCERSMAMFFYSEKIQTREILNEDGEFFRDFIQNFLKIIGDSKTILGVPLSKGATANYDIYVLELNLFPTNEDTYESQLNFTPHNDVYPLVNIKKIQFLDSLGYKISSHPDISLRSYLGLLYLNPKWNIFIGEQNRPIPTINYKLILSELKKKQLISQLQITSQLDAIKSIQMYAITNEQIYIPENYGLLVYSQGRLVKRCATNFGQLFEKKFFKNKYKKKLFNLHKQIGIIDTNSNLLKPDILETDFEYNRLSMMAWTSIKLNFKMEEAKLRPLNQKRLMLLGKSEKMTIQKS